jgi:hypothetical protein
VYVSESSNKASREQAGRRSTERNTRTDSKEMPSTVIARLKSNKWREKNRRSHSCRQPPTYGELRKSIKRKKREATT